MVRLCAAAAHKRGGFGVPHIRSVPIELSSAQRSARMSLIKSGAPAAQPSSERSAD